MLFGVCASIFFEGGGLIFKGDFFEGADVLQCKKLNENEDSFQESLNLG